MTDQCIGSGGVLLPYYSPYKVAEQFNLMSALFPGRIDLGLGRSGGSEGQAPAALGVRNHDSFRALDELFHGWGGEQTGLSGYICLAKNHACGTLGIGYKRDFRSLCWRTRITIAFGGSGPRGLVDALRTYHQSFQPGWLQKPRVNFGWYVQAAETEKAKAMTRSSEHWL